MKYYAVIDTNDLTDYCCIQHCLSVTHTRTDVSAYNTEGSGNIHKRQYLYRCDTVIHK